MSSHQQEQPAGSSRPSTSDTTVPAPVVKAEQQDSVKREVGGSTDFWFLPIPKNLRYDSERPFVFTTVLNISFGFGSTFSE